MAKAAPVDLAAGMPFAAAAARTVAVRAEEVFGHAEGVLDVADIERVHAMRVATRRLRAVLEIFAPCFPAAEHRALLREVKDLADALGARRDPDVQLAAIDALEGAMGEPERPGLEAFADRVRAEQTEGNERLAAALDHVARSHLRERLRALAVAAEPEPAA
jgi:CHAD domain-containing protein